MCSELVPRNAYRLAAVAGLALAAVPVRAQVAPPSPASPAVAPVAPSAPQSVPPAATPPVALPADEFDVDDTLAPLPDIGLAWPDLTDRSDELVDGVQVPQSAAPVLAERRYSVRLEGIDGIGSDLLRSRFDELSTLRQNDGEPANGAQIDRRAREDAELLIELLRAEGYYDAAVRPEVEPAGDRLVVTLRARPGEVYRLAQVDLGNVSAAGTQAPQIEGALGLTEDDPANADRIVAGEAGVRAEVGRLGFPFAKIGEPELVVNHETRSATLTLPVDPGARARYGAIRMPDTRVFGPDHAQTIARWDPGDTYDAELVTDLGRALIATGLVSSADVRPVPAADPALVDIAVAIEPAPPRTISGELGFGTGEGARAAVTWQHRNLFPPEGALALRGVVGTREQFAGVTFRRNNWNARDRVLTAQLSAGNVAFDAYDARTVSLSAGIERVSNIIYQKDWTWSIGAELLVTDERDTILVTGEDRRRTFGIAALPASLAFDGTDDLLDPTRGFRLGGRLSPELSLQGSVFGYARTQVDASLYLPVRDGVTVAARTRLGTIAGADRDDIAPSRRFYAGGGGSVRGYTFQAIGPRDADNNPIGGKSLAEFSLEARVRFGDFGIVPFVDAGNISTGSLPRFDNLRIGAGLGVRYHTNFGPIRVDVGTPINPAPGDPRIAVYVSLGQAF